MIEPNQKMTCLVFKFDGGDLSRDGLVGNIGAEQIYGKNGFTPEQLAYGKKLLKECADKFMQSL